MKINQRIEILNTSCHEIGYEHGITITDPPYNQKYHYNSYGDNLKDDDYLMLLRSIQKPCVIIHYPEETINLLPKVFGKCEQVVTWVYNSNTGKQSRLISWWGCKPDLKLVTQPYKNSNDKRVKALIDKGRTGSKLYDWWEINQVKNVSKEKTKHPCQIPEELIRRIILTTVKKDQLIIDPFLGSGTTLKVAADLGYSGLGYEIDPVYYKIACDRILGTNN